MRQNSPPKGHRTSAGRLFDALVIRSWWVVAFTLSCYALYERASSNQSEAYSLIASQYAQCLEEQQRAEARFLRLQRQVESQNDPRWVEMTLMKELGMVPKGQTKVYFKDA